MSAAPEGKTSAKPLICAECGTEAPPDAKGWQSHLGYDPREDEQPEAFVFCPRSARSGSCQ